MLDKHLHIVCLDVPYPADYGGVSDIFYKIKALHKLGIKIHLHCFEYGRSKAAELNKYCTEVNYYKRNTGIKGLSFRLPYIVNSRANKSLLQNLFKDEHPILLEGIHCTYFLFTNQLKDREVIVRIHNVEYTYYDNLAKNETSFLRKLYYNNESRLLKMYENEIASRAMLAAISQNDAAVYKAKFKANDVKYIPAFVPFAEVNIKNGSGTYCLYHANLAVKENELAATWLVENVFSQLDIPFVIAGKNPAKKLHSLINKSKNISLVPNPSEEKMNELISNAQINVLPSITSTGIKIKLLHALFTGRHCLVNNVTIQGTGLHTLCHTAETETEFKTLIQQLFLLTFTDKEIVKRKEFLEKEFNNEANAKQLMQWIH